MLNSGGALESLAYDDHESSVTVGVRGCGEIKAFASAKPIRCQMDGVDMDFGYDDEDHTATVQVPWPGSSRLSVIKYWF